MAPTDDLRGVSLRICRNHLNEQLVALAEQLFDVCLVFGRKEHARRDLAGILAKGNIAEVDLLDAHRLGDGTGLLDRLANYEELVLIGHTALERLDGILGVFDDNLAALRFCKGQGLQTKLVIEDRVAYQQDAVGTQSRSPANGNLAVQQSIVHANHLNHDVLPSD